MRRGSHVNSKGRLGFKLFRTLQFREPHAIRYYLNLKNLLLFVIFYVRPFCDGLVSASRGCYVRNIREMLEQVTQLPRGNREGTRLGVRMKESLDASIQAKKSCSYNCFFRIFLQKG